MAARKERAAGTRELGIESKNRRNLIQMCRILSQSFRTWADLKKTMGLLRSVSGINELEDGSINGDKLGTDASGNTSTTGTNNRRNFPFSFVIFLMPSQPLQLRPYAVVGQDRALVLLTSIYQIVNVNIVDNNNIS